MKSNIRFILFAALTILLNSISFNAKAQVGDVLFVQENLQPKSASMSGNALKPISLRRFFSSVMLIGAEPAQFRYDSLFFAPVHLPDLDGTTQDIRACTTFHSLNGRYTAQIGNAVTGPFPDFSDFSYKSKYSDALKEGYFDRGILAHSFVGFDCVTQVSNYLIPLSATKDVTHLQIILEVGPAPVKLTLHPVKDANGADIENRSPIQGFDCTRIVFLDGYECRLPIRNATVPPGAYRLEVEIKRPGRKTITRTAFFGLP